MPESSQRFARNFAENAMLHFPAVDFTNSADLGFWCTTEDITTILRDMDPFLCSAPILAESTFLGLSETAWVGISTITALAIAVGGIVWPWYKQQRFAPRISLDLGRAMTFSTQVGNGFWVRVPVTNDPDRDTAENVEVFLESVANDDGTLEDFVPMRLTWSHTSTASCDRIPGGTYRLVDLGVLTARGSVERREGDILAIQAPTFEFCGEVPPRAPKPLAIDGVRLKVSLILSNDHSDPRRQLLQIIFLKTDKVLSLRVENA